MRNAEEGRALEADRNNPYSGDILKESKRREKERRQRHRQQFLREKEEPMFKAWESAQQESRGTRRGFDTVKVLTQRRRRVLHHRKIQVLFLSPSLFLFICWNTFYLFLNGSIPCTLGSFLTLSLCLSQPFFLTIDHPPNKKKKQPP